MFLKLVFEDHTLEDLDKDVTSDYLMWSSLSPLSYYNGSQSIQYN